MTGSPSEVLRRCRGQSHLVALVGDWQGGQAIIAWDPLRELRRDGFDGIDELPTVSAPGLFGGGWIGAWGYQLGGDPERSKTSLPRPCPQPHRRMAFYDRVLRLVDDQWWFEQLARLVHPLQDEERRNDFLSVLERDPGTEMFFIDPFEMTPTPRQHGKNVARAVEHIRAGDIFQVNLATRLEAAFTGDPLDVFCKGVEALHPAYAAFVSGPDGAVASMSPELFLRREGDEVIASPIKGTAPLSTDPALLTASKKDRAENVMIVDLMRNDLGRVAMPGSIRVPALVRPEKHAVWHLVSDVTATLEAGTSHSQLLRAVFPPGSVTGAPKVRAMELIEDLEATARETYTGAIGYVSPALGMELNVAIRTFEFARGRVWLGVGGAVVADSTPEGEYAECLTKARPLIDAIGGRLKTGLVDKRDPPLPAAASQSSLPAADRSLDTRLGIFETLLVRGGRPAELDAHLARADSSTRMLFGAGVGREARGAVQRHAAGLAGTCRLRVDFWPVDAAVRFKVESTAISHGVKTLRLSTLCVPGGLGAHKWSDRRTIAEIPSSCNGLLIVDQDGCVLETDRASIFAVFGDGVRTPPLDGRLLPGVTRSQVIDLLRAAGLPIDEAGLTCIDLAGAHEVFATNSVRGVVPVTAILGHGTFPVGATTAWVRAKLNDPGLPPRTPSRPGAGARSVRVLIIDNYDSFVYNLAQYIAELGSSVTVVRNDRLAVDDLVRRQDEREFTHILISPGPGAPRDAGVSVEVVRRLGRTTPILGVCLGHQAIVEAYGGAVVRARQVVHGKSTLIHHDQRGVHSGLSGPLAVGRYHSLVLDEASLPSALVVTSRTADGLPMGVRHRKHRVEGVQWHPESILTTSGRQVLANFIS